ncbi:hypothetical protein TcYC6_0033590 [Trypanosoma cruzi]|nr:hypothetical protein TcYC6_0033590 [Trypanosoma cruzi]
MALLSFYTASEWGDIVARLPDSVRQNGAVQVQLAFIDENCPSDATLTAATPMTGLRMDFGKHHQTLGGFEPYRTCCESPGASSTKFRDSIAPAHRVGAARELGASKGTSLLK